MDPCLTFQYLRHKYGDWLLTLLDSFAGLDDICLRASAGKGLLRIPRICNCRGKGGHRRRDDYFGKPDSTRVDVRRVSCQCCRVLFGSFHPLWPYNLHLLAAAWLIIAITVGTIVARAVFRRGRVTYHRIVGAVLLYLLVAVGFASLFAFVGLSITDAFKGVAFEDNAALASELFYLSFVTLTTTGFGDIVPVHPLARSLCNIEAIVGQLYPATLLARLVTLELRGG